MLLEKKMVNGGNQFVIRMSLRRNSYDKETRYLYYSQTLDSFEFDVTKRTVYYTEARANEKLEQIKKYAIGINRIKVIKIPN